MTREYRKPEAIEAERAKIEEGRALLAQAAKTDPAGPLRECGIPAFTRGDGLVVFAVGSEVFTARDVKKLPTASAEAAKAQMPDSPKAKAGPREVEATYRPPQERKKHVIGDKDGNTNTPPKELETTHAIEMGW